MTEFVSTLKHLSLRGSPYLVVLANESKYRTPIQRHLDEAATTFGETAGLKARVIRSYKTKSSKVYCELERKAWPSDIAKRMKSEHPFLVFFQKDFAEFDPKQHRWVIVWILALGSSEKMIPNFFHRLDQKLTRDQDLFTYLEEKLDGKDHAFPKGSLSARGHTDSAAPISKPGRKHMLRDVSLSQLRKIVEKYEIDLLTRGGKMELSRRLSEIITDRNGNHFLPKSLCDALTKGKYFDALGKTSAR